MKFSLWIRGSRCSKVEAPVLRIASFFLPFICTVTLLAQQPTDCSYFNTTPGPFEISSADSQQHKYGEHFWTDTTNGTCSYIGSASPSGPVPCNVISTAAAIPAAYETGALDNNHSLDTHFRYTNSKGGTATSSNGGSATADAEGAVAVSSCVFSCAINISMTGSGEDAGFGVGFVPTPLWAKTDHYTNGCAAATLPTLQTSCTPNIPPPSQSTQNGYWTWDTGSCQWVWVNCASDTGNCSPGGSPIVIDTLNKGFVFTDPTLGDYVTFDLKGDGTYEHLSWPKAGSGNAWLVYDRDGDGVIKDGTELFGNFTPHSDGDVPNRDVRDKNGFLALQWYDHPPQGGNGDLILDKEDEIWSKLRLWIDEHCYLTPTTPCQSRPSELHRLESKGVHSLSLVYTYDPTKVDAVGNHYRFYAVVNPEISDYPVDPNGHHHDGNSDCCDHHTKSKDGRMMYDVFLKAIP